MTVKLLLLTGAVFLYDKEKEVAAMFLREAAAEEMAYLYKIGYSEWPKGRTYEQYVEDNQKEESYGTRYVYVEEAGKILASLIMIKLRPHLFGIGSVVVHPEHRQKGHGKQLLKECMEYVQKSEAKAAFMLYSEIGTDYYERLGFQAVPDCLQRYSYGICMVHCDPHTYKQILKNPVPNYF